MKKLIAGLLAIASVLSVSVSAQAAAVKNVTKPGELQFDISATNPKVVLNIVMPSQMKAAINPYGSEFQIDYLNTIHTQNGIVSVAYPVYNLDTDYGVFIDAKGITTTSSDAWSVTKNTLTPGVKGANMAVTASATEGGIPQYSNVAKAATSATSQGNMPLDSTVPADSAKGTAKGETRQQKLAYVPASADGETPSKVFIGFAGKLADDSADTVVNWTESDSINVQLILKITPGPKTF
ncbi:MAG: hypothetical protein K2J77_00240 [Oscillospiraceae bacterium]|nr:hypothetical protein [Oscillospiraceae bacterium]